MTSLAGAEHRRRSGAAGERWRAGCAADPPATVSREDVHFLAEDGTLLSAWLYLPIGGAAPRPAITMANGFAGTRRHGVDRFAQAFAEAGFAVLLHDHRNFGTSGGAERGDADPWQQISDWRRAIAYLQARPEAAGDRIGLWGTGYAASHALVLGATDRRLRAIVAQMPTTSGSTRDMCSNIGVGQEDVFREDCRRRLAGQPGLRVAIASSDGAVLAPYRSPDALAFFDQRAPGERRENEIGERWENEITVRSLRASLAYVPEAWLAFVAPTPLMLVTTSETVEIDGPERAGSRRSLSAREDVTLHGGPFSPFQVNFPSASSAAIRWFSAHL